MEKIREWLKRWRADINPGPLSDAYRDQTKVRLAELSRKIDDLDSVLHTLVDLWRV